MGVPRKYSPELQERATRMTVEARSDPNRARGAIARIAGQLGAHPEVLSSWATRLTNSARETSPVPQVRMLAKSAILGRGTGVVDDVSGRDHLPVHPQSDAKAAKGEKDTMLVRWCPGRAGRGTTLAVVWSQPRRRRRGRDGRWLGQAKAGGWGYSYDALLVLRQVWAASGGQYGKYLAASTRTQLDLLEEVLGRFKHYLLVERSISVPVADAYVRWVRPFVQAVAAGDAELTFDGVDAAQVAGFVAVHLPGLTRKTAQMTASSLRSFLRFLHAEGTVAVDLSVVVPPFAYPEAVRAAATR